MSDCICSKTKELDEIKGDVKQIRGDVEYIRGKIDGQSSAGLGGMLAMIPPGMRPWVQLILLLGAIFGGSYGAVQIHTSQAAPAVEVAPGE